MPHFSISPSGWRIGDLLKGSIPRLGINWYAKGGVFDKPTLFATPSGLKGVGEAGPEAVAPISKLQEMIDWNSDRDLLVEIIELLKQILSKNPNIYMDRDTLVGAIIDEVDELSAEKKRMYELALGGV